MSFLPLTLALALNGPMKTLTLTLSEETFARLQVVAELKGTSVEDEVVRHIAIPEGRPLINNRDELHREAEAFHRDLAARGICFSADEISEAIREARI